MPKGTETPDEADLSHMLAALGLARRGLGRTWPNPAVGCVLVRPEPGRRAAEGIVVGRGWTQPGGRPHAESEALRRAGDLARGATAYVTLEPCAHWGQTPPCAEALVAAGVARVVFALADPDPRVSGRGRARLAAADIAVTEGIAADEAAALNAGFFMRIRHGRPLVTVKLATTLDGRIATRSGDSRWITGDAARARSHALRATHDAVLVGVGTAIRDDPLLTCRLPGMSERSPVRVVLDPRLRLSTASRLLATARLSPTWVVTHDPDPRRREDFRAHGVEVIDGAVDAEGRLDLAAVLASLGERGVTRVLVEAGGRVAGALLRGGLVDRIAWFRAPLVIGDDGEPAARGLGVERLIEALRFRRTEILPLGPDALETYIRQDAGDTACSPASSPIQAAFSRSRRTA